MGGIALFFTADHFASINEVSDINERRRERVVLCRNRFWFFSREIQKLKFPLEFDSRESVGLKWIFRNKHETKDSLKKSDYLMHFKRIDGCLCRIEEVSGHSVASCNSIVNLNEK